MSKFGSNNWLFRWNTLFVLDEIFWDEQQYIYDDNLIAGDNEIVACEVRHRASLIDLACSDFRYSHRETLAVKASELDTRMVLLDTVLGMRAESEEL